MLTTLILLPTGGGGFPDEMYGMTELIGHEAGHSWVLPFAGPMWNEPIATYIGAQLAKRLEMEEQANAIFARNIKNARKHDAELNTIDIAYGEDVPNAVHWGKAMYIWEELSKEKPDALARYFQAKRKLVDPENMDKYTPDDCVAVMSVAMERDLFPWMQSLGLTVDSAKTKIPMEW